MGGNKGKQTLADFVYSILIHIPAENCNALPPQNCLSVYSNLLKRIGDKKHPKIQTFTE